MSGADLTGTIGPINYFITRLPKNQKSRNNTELASKITISIIILLHESSRLNWIYMQTSASKNVMYDTDMATI